MVGLGIALLLIVGLFKLVGFAVGVLAVLFKLALVFLIVGVVVDLLTGGRFYGRSR